VNSDHSAGFSVVEMLVVAAILAGVAVVLAGSLRPQPPSGSADAESLQRFLLEARSDTVLSGTPRVVTLEAAQANFTDKTLQWTGDLHVGSNQAPAEYRLVINADGTFSGMRPILVLNGTRVSAPGVYWSEPAQ
jgi:type II secretory pathway pseudopilin PulG